MKIQKIHINENHKVLFFDVGSETRKNKTRGRMIMKMVYLISTKAEY